MKRNSYLFFLLMAAVLFTRCDDNLMELNKGDNPLEIAVSAPQLQLDAANPEAEALKLTWSSGTNRGTNAAISYTLQIDPQVALPEVSPLDSAKPMRKFPHEELNNLLLAEFDATPGEAVAFEARVTATVSLKALSRQPQRAVAFVITLQTHHRTLYLIGDATPMDGMRQCHSLRKVPNKPRTFSWTAAPTGNFKFITTLESVCTSTTRAPLRVPYRGELRRPYMSLSPSPARHLQLSGQPRYSDCHMAKGEGRPIGALVRGQPHRLELCPHGRSLDPLSLQRVSLPVASSK